MNRSPQPWTQKYLRDAIRDEVELARAMDYTVAMPTSITAVMALIPTQQRGYRFMPPSSQAGLNALPNWRRSWSAAGPLATELALAVVHDLDDGTVSAGAGGRRRNVTEAYADHPSKDAATMAAIVRAAIEVLKAAHE